MSYYKSASEIQEELLNYMDSRYSKEKGHWLWEILKAVACGLSDFTLLLDEAANKLYAEKLQGDDLDDYLYNWCHITRKDATRAVGYVTFTAKSGETGTVAEGTLVSNGDVNYSTTESGEITAAGGTVTVPVAACVYGSRGNSESGTVNKMITSVDFVETVTNAADIAGGEDEEPDDELRERYYQAMKKRANAGNKAHYEELAREIDGVGQAYCVACPNDTAGTADVYVVGPEGGAVAADVITAAQNYIDPNKNGDGKGEAPIGAVVTVKNPTSTTVNVSFDVALQEGYTVDHIRDSVSDRITAYFNDAFTERLVRYNQVGKCILETEGVKDFKNLLLNGGTSNISGGDGIYFYALGNLDISLLVGEG